MPAHPYPRVTSFRTRHSTLSTAQQQTWDRLWPELGMQARDGDGQPAGELDTDAWFGRSAPLVLEIGCGAGVSTLAMAIEEPHVDVIAVEVYRRGLGQLLSGVDREGLTNVRMIRGDGVDVLEHLLAPDVADRRARVLPRPVAQGAPPQAQAVAALDRRVDRRPAAPWRRTARRHRSRRVRRTDRRGRRRRTAAAPGSPPTPSLPISVRRPTTNFEAKAHRAGSAITEFLWTKSTPAARGIRS